MIVLAGPTASGKTELAAALAERLGGEVISADSRQVYRFLDAATAKPCRALRDRVPHHLLDVAGPEEAYDAARFAREADAAAREIRARGKIPIVCGGTGLYLRALLEGLAVLPPRDESLRAELEETARREGREALHARLAAVDPAAAAKIPAGNLARVVRALEVARSTGRPISEAWDRPRVGARPADLILILEVPNDVLRARIEVRARAMWPFLRREVAALVPARFRGDEPGFTSLGYREALAVSRGELSDEEGLAGLLRATHAYAKRQRTWFRHQLAGRRISAGGQAQDAFAAALAAWEASRETHAA
jgi:tRNA dimethylallyltransferase